MRKNPRLGLVALLQFVASAAADVAVFAVVVVAVVAVAAAVVVVAAVAVVADVAVAVAVADLEYQFEMPHKSVLHLLNIFPFPSCKFQRVLCHSS